VTSAHIFFIPGMILIGMFLGFIFGARAARNQIDIQKKRDEEREAARAARAARRENKVDIAPAPDPVVADEKPVEEAVKDDKPTKKLKNKR
jgi:hypothetical protein